MNTSTDNKFEAVVHGAGRVGDGAVAERRHQDHLLPASQLHVQIGAVDQGQLQRRRLLG